MANWILPAFLICALPAAAAPLAVMIDPGHGGRDHGAARRGVYESDITLAVARRLVDLLNKDNRFTPQLSREADTSVTLYRRAVTAKTKKADVFLSIHVNSNPDVKAKGAEFYFQNQLPPDEESMFLAHKENTAEEGENVEPLTYDFIDKNPMAAEVAAIVGDLLDGDRVQRSSELSRDLKLSWRGTRKSKTNSVRQAPFYVLSQMRSPSALVELGFLTNDDDFHELTSPEDQQRMAEDLYHGLIAFKESMDKRKQSP
jgi:N-acetylmuramoyl-L-alanine amidase